MHWVKVISHSFDCWYTTESYKCTLKNRKLNTAITIEIDLNNDGGSTIISYHLMMDDVLMENLNQ